MCGLRQAMQRRKISHVLICHPQLPEQHPGAFKAHRAHGQDLSIAPAETSPSHGVIGFYAGKLFYTPALGW